MSYSIETCRQFWEEKMAKLSDDELTVLHTGWTQYWDLLSEKTTDKIPPLTEDIMTFLQRENVFDGCESALDIGCGTGNYTLLLADVCKKVTAIDISQKSLAVLDRRSGETKGTVETVCSDWSLFFGNNLFDITFSSMSPAICDVESLEKMEAYSKRRCILISPAKNSYSLIRKSIREKLTDQPLPGLSADAIYIYNYIYAQGRNPNMKIFPQSFKSKIPFSEAYENYSCYFEIFGFDDQVSKKIIDDTIGEFTSDGFVIDEVNINTAVMYWNSANK